METGRPQHEAAKHGADDLAEVADRVQPTKLQAALSRQLARHRPGRRPEGRSREDERHLPSHQHPETVREDEPDARGEHHEARAQHDAAAADAIGISAPDEVERRLREHRRGKQRADFGVGQPLRVRV